MLALCCSCKDCFLFVGIGVLFRSFPYLWSHLRTPLLQGEVSSQTRLRARTGGVGVCAVPERPFPVSRSGRGGVGGSKIRWTPSHSKKGNQNCILIFKCVITLGTTLGITRYNSSYNSSYNFSYTCTPHIMSSSSLSQIYLSSLSQLFVTHLSQLSVSALCLSSAYVEVRHEWRGDCIQKYRFA